MSAVGYPDDEERALPFGSVLSSDAGLAVPASPAGAVIGPFTVQSWQSVLLQFVAVTNPVTATFVWSLDGASGAASTSTVARTLAVGTSRVTVANQGHVLDSITFSGVGGAATLRYALVGANPFSGSAEPGGALLASCRLNQTAAQVIGNLVEVVVSWNSVSFDTAGLFNPGSPTLLTIPVRGIYGVTTYVQWAANAAGFRRIKISKATPPAAKIAHALDNRPAVVDAGWTTENSTATILACEVGDQITVEVEQSSGGNLNVNATLNSITAFGLGPGP